MAAALVGLFGVAGALLRFGVDSWFARHYASHRPASGGNSQRSWRTRPHWPWATLLVNVTGCFLIGISHAVTTKLGLAAEWETALATGLAGGLTTFSSWTTATVRLLTEARLGAAAMNVAANLVLGFASAATGVVLGS